MPSSPAEPVSSAYNRRLWPYCPYLLGIGAVIVLVVMFAVYAFSDAVMQGTRAFSSDGFGPVLGHLLLGLIDIAAGVFALAWPAPTALVLVLVWASGRSAAARSFFSAFAAGETAGTRALLLLGGLVSIAFGVVPLVAAVG
jgi:uncharacterized membrane protein HdeD (DUF308 family)